MTQAVIDLIQAYMSDFELLLNKLKSHTTRKKNPSGGFALKAGDICRYIFFIEQGSFRSYVVREDKEINIWFMFEGDTASAPKSFIYQEPTKEYIEAMEETVVTCISLEDLQSLCREFPAFQTMVLDLLWKYHTMFYDRVMDLLDKSPEERLQYLMEKQPDLWQRVHEKYLSSYLGMSVSTWTRAKPHQKPGANRFT